MLIVLVILIIIGLIISFAVQVYKHKHPTPTHPNIAIDFKYYEYSLGPNVRDEIYSYIDTNDLYLTITVKKGKIAYINAAEDTVEGEGVINTNNIEC